MNQQNTAKLGFNVIKGPEKLRRYKGVLYHTVKGLNQILRRNFVQQ
jgi:hypothetical protein